MIKSRPSLQDRLARHFVFFAAGLIAVLTSGAWWVLTETEDAVLDRYLALVLPFAGSDAPPAWVETFTGEAALKRRLSLSSVPHQPGWHTVFADDTGREARIVRGWSDRLAVWARGDLEQEYRLQTFLQPDGRAAWRLIDLAPLEYSETQMPRLQAWLLGLGALALWLAWLLSRKLARSAMAPVLDLAARLGTRAPDTGPLVLTTGNVDEVGQLAQALDAAWMRERGALERERRFIAECSHELRTPLAVLSGALSLLEEQTDDPAAREAVLARLRRTARRLEGVAETFLVLAREERRRDERLPQPVLELLDDAIAEQRLLFPQRSLRVILDVPEDSSVDGPREVLLVLFRNLLGNTFQHSATHALRVDWRESPTPHLRFTETPTTAPRPSPSHGYGLGLPLVRRLTAQQGWKFEETTDAASLSQTIWFEAAPPTGI